jgi:hypothetical protein
MALADLIVLNRNSSGDTSTSLLPHACVIGTCLREVRIAMLAADDQPLPAEALAAGYDLHTGADAYGFLLQLACGLESEIAGETEILGQVKQAWRDCEAGGGDLPRLLRPWMQRLLQDTKEIRSEYVVGLGSATYGSLVRRLLGGTSHGPTLLLGAGQLAETILPFLDTGDVQVWNRSRARAEEMLARQRVTQTRGRVHLLDSTVSAEEAAWRKAHDVIICIPADAERDAVRVSCWLQRSAHEGRILHLGIDSAAGTPWSRIGKVATLRDLFGLRDLQATQREAMLLRARKACADKAQLARLDDADGSRAGSSNHGWEDLAVFQAFSY